MRIPCPFCGDRDIGEFVCRGEAGAPRPDTTTAEGEAALFDHLYLRDNPRGPLKEHWHHAYGCRRWLTVERDTRTHAVLAAVLAQDGGS